MENFIFCEVWVDVMNDIQPSNSARFVFINRPKKKKKFLTELRKPGLKNETTK